MKPSTYKKMKHMRDRMGKWFGLTIYYFLYPIVYLVRLIRERSDENLKKRSTPEYATSLVAKEIYEKLLRKKTSEDVVVIAEYVERNVGWDTPWSIFGFYLRNGKASKSYQFMKKEQKEMNDNQFMELVLKKFKEMNKYTFVTEYMDERAAKTSYIKGYEKSIKFGIRSE